MERFIPRKRTALDGKTWWCVYDTVAGGWSSYVCHGRYRRKKDADFAINYYAMKGWY